jgi:hypothetical protein
MSVGRILSRAPSFFFRFAIKQIVSFHARNGLHLHYLRGRPQLHKGSKKGFPSGCLFVFCLHTRSLPHLAKSRHLCSGDFFYFFRFLRETHPLPTNFEERGPDLVSGLFRKPQVFPRHQEGPPYAPPSRLMRCGQMRLSGHSKVLLLVCGTHKRDESVWP